MNLSLAWLNTLFFIVIRLGPVLLLSPIQALRQVPVLARVLLIFVLALLLINYLPTQTRDNNSELLISSLAEFSNGLILSTSLYACFAVFQIAGQIIDNQIGLNAISIFNPTEHGQESLSSHLFSMLAVLFFFGVDGHLWLFKGLAQSFIMLPPGSLGLFSGFTPVIKQFGFSFSMAFMLASPIVLAMLAIDYCSGLITRTMPQVSTYFLSLPIKIMLGLLLLNLLLNYFQPISNLVFARCFQTWQEVMS